MTNLETLPYHKLYYLKNKDKKREYYNINKDKIRQREKQYYKSDNGNRRKLTNRWKQRGIKGDLDELYDIREKAIICWACFKPFGEGEKKCLDHDHVTGEFRAVLCYACNTHDNWMKYTDDLGKP